MPTPDFLEPNYFKITCIDDGGSDFDMPELGVQFKSSKNGTAPAVKLYYRINGARWIEWGLNLKKQLVTGDYIEIKGDPSNTTFCGTTNPLTNADSITLNFNAGALPVRPTKVKVSGDITTLLDGIGGILDISDRVACFAWLFNHSDADMEVDCEDLELPSTTLGSTCYKGMFSNLSEQLKKAPKELPAETIAPSAYNAMFQHCTSITRAPFIMATSCGTLGCQKMFYSCNSLEYIKCSLAPNELTAMKLNSWVNGVRSEGVYEYTDPDADPNSFLRGNNGVPAGWELRLAQEDTMELYLNGNKVKMLAINGRYVKTLFINGNKVLWEGAAPPPSFKIQNKGNKTDYPLDTKIIEVMATEGITCDIEISDAVIGTKTGPFRETFPCDYGQWIKFTNVGGTGEAYVNCNSDGRYVMTGTAPDNWTINNVQT